MKERVLKTKKEKLHFILGELNIPNINITYFSHLHPRDFCLTTPKIWAI